MYSGYIKSLFAFLLLSYAILNYAYAADDSMLNRSNQLFDFAEENFPQFFSPSGEGTFEFEDYWTRYYSKTDTYIGTLGEDVYVYGVVFDGLLYVGKMSDFITSSSPSPSHSDPIKSWKISGMLVEDGCGRGFVVEEYQDKLTYDGESYIFTSLGIEISDFTTFENSVLNNELIEFGITSLNGDALTDEKDYLLIQGNGDVAGRISSFMTGNSSCTKAWTFVIGTLL